MRPLSKHAFVTFRIKLSCSFCFSLFYFTLLAKFHPWRVNTLAYLFWDLLLWSLFPDLLLIIVPRPNSLIIVPIPTFQIIVPRPNSLIIVPIPTFLIIVPRPTSDHCSQAYFWSLFPDLILWSLFPDRPCLCCRRLVPRTQGTDRRENECSWFCNWTSCS